MHNHILSIIALSMTLTISNLHAGAGYNFHFDLPKTVSMPLDSYISRMLPDDQRAPIEYLDEIDKLKKVMNIKTPVFVMNASLDKGTVGLAENIGFDNLKYSIVRLSVKTFERQTRNGIPWANTQALAHELGHVKNNHYGKVNALRMLRYQSLLGLLCPEYLDKKIEALDCRYNGTYVESTRKAEYEAEISGITALARCGYTNAIKANVEFRKECLRNRLRKNVNEIIDHPSCNHAYDEVWSYCEDVESLLHKTRDELTTDIGKLLTPTPKETQYSFFNPQYWKIEDHAHAAYIRKAKAEFLAEIIDEELNQERPQGFIYPTMKEMITYQSTGLAECLEITNIDPRTTQDTPNLMRNGSSNKVR